MNRRSFIKKLGIMGSAALSFPSCFSNRKEPTYKMGYQLYSIRDEMAKITRDYTELGNGSINYLELLPDPIKSGLEFYYLEQGGNYATNSIISAADSAQYFKKNLQQFL